MSRRTDALSRRLLAFVRVENGGNERYRTVVSTPDYRAGDYALWWSPEAVMEVDGYLFTYYLWAGDQEGFGADDWLKMTVNLSRQFPSGRVSFRRVAVQGIEDVARGHARESTVRSAEVPSLRR